MVPLMARPVVRLLTRPSLLKSRLAFISSKILRPDDYERYPPWPYKEKGFTNWHSLFVDNTTKRFDENTKVIFVEGMPAIGKSSFAKKLAEDLDMHYFPMVTMDLLYINYYGYDIRQLDPEFPKAARSFDEKRFFREPKHPQNIFFQTSQLVLKMHQYFDALAHIFNTGQGVVVERSPYSDFVFAEAMYKCKYFTRLAYDAYNNYYKELMKVIIRPHLVIYLDAPNSVVYENLKKRGLGEENAITPEFLETMEEKYKFKFLKDIETHAEVLIYDWTEPGDVEVIVEDLERLDLNRWDVEAETHNPKLKDWRFDNEDHANKYRWTFTNQKEHDITGTVLNACTFECDDEFISADDYKKWVEKIDSVPGMKYDVGWSPDMGDKVLFKRKTPQVFAELMLRNFQWR